MANPDIYIKDEGYADCRLHKSQKAKEWCHENGYTNSLIDFGKTWCGQPIWYPGMTTGVYKFALLISHVPEFIKAAEAAGLIIESEF